MISRHHVITLSLVWFNQNDSNKSGQPAEEAYKRHLSVPSLCAADCSSGQGPHFELVGVALDMYEDRVHWGYKCPFRNYRLQMMVCTLGPIEIAARYSNAGILRDLHEILC
jgi:hypothetical protein